jgi:hypothetical protein
MFLYSGVFCVCETYRFIHRFIYYKIAEYLKFVQKLTIPSYKLSVLLSNLSKSVSPHFAHWAQLPWELV